MTVTVRDTGPGIPPEVRPNMFRNGFTTKLDPLSRHSGLGLSLVQRTVTKLGGSVRVEGGPGATFVVVLPRTASPKVKEPVQ